MQAESTNFSVSQFWKFVGYSTARNIFKAGGIALLYWLILGAILLLGDSASAHIGISKDTIPMWLWYVIFFGCYLWSLRGQTITVSNFRFGQWVAGPIGSCFFHVYAAQPFPIRASRF
jgi:hypothetical protein